MDNKAIFVRTGKGEDEAHSKTSHLGGDVKRALLMVDGSATFGEISKRAAPSLRANLESLIEELKKNGYIEDKDKVSTIPKMSVPPKFATPKIVTPQKNQPAEEDEDAGELDFMSGFSTSPPAPSQADANKAEEEKAAKLKADAEAKSRQELEAAKLNAQREAEAILRKAELEAAKLREETERRAKATEEAARAKAEQEENKLREELATAKLKAEQEAKQRFEAAAREHEQAEAARKKAEEARLAKAQEEAVRLKAEQDAKKLREELEAAKLKAEQEAKQRFEAAAREHEQAEAARKKAEEDARMQAELEAAKEKAKLEAQARLDAAAKAHARMKEEEEKAARLEAEAKAAHKPEKTTSAPSGNQDAFSFDSFQIGEPAIPAQETPAAEHANTSGDSKSGNFAFDSFQVEEFSTTEELSPPAQKAEEVSPPEKPSPSEPGGFAFDSFKVEEPPAPAKTEKITPTQEAQLSEAQPAPPVPEKSKTAASKADSEKKKHTEQARIEAEKRMAAEEQAKKLADEQAKVWAEAEHRALETAKENVGKTSKKAEHHAPEKAVSAHPTPRAKSKPFPWGKLLGFFLKLGIFLLVLLVGALFIAPYIIPMRDYMPKVEKYMSERMKQPVHIGYLSGQLLPSPRLDIGEIYFGEVKQFQATQAQLHFNLMGLFDEKKTIDSVVLSKVKVSGKGLQSVSLWLQQLAANDLYPVRRIEINEGTLDADAFEITGVEGVLNFNASNKFTQANLRANAGKYKFILNVTPENKLQVDISVNDKLPLLPNWVFDDLNAKGELTNKELVINDFNARISGGALQGKANIKWDTGWHAQGTMKATSIAMKQLNELLDGSIDGTASFKMASTDLAGLTNNATLEGDFTSENGIINGMDIVETARTRSKEHLPGGRTHFSEFNGGVSYANNNYHFSQLRISTDVMIASGELNIEKRELSGSINAKLSIQENMPPVDLKLGGTLESPQLRYSR